MGKPRQKVFTLSTYCCFVSFLTIRCLAPFIMGMPSAFRDRESEPMARSARGGEKVALLLMANFTTFLESYLILPAAARAEG